MNPARLKRVTGGGLEIGVPLALLVLWAVLTGRETSFFFPPLLDIIRTFQETWLFARVGSDVVPSLTRLFAGYAIAVLAGIAIGMALGSSHMLRRMADPVVQFLRAIPPPVLIPAGILILGVGSTMKIALIAFVCFWPILLNTIDGVDGVDPTQRETARSFQIPRRDRLFRVVLPSAAPQIFAGARVSLALAVIMMVVSEMVASTNGIGYFVLQSQRTYAITQMWSGILLLALLGFTLNLVFLLVERRVLRWHRGARGGAT
ncbi:ABC-type nitrate/sulfonate/bicarbonate transport system permease component [Lipingzhangella halophila]|uniref:ABC-type nitrate/sulfonate/bicarbonate transport system permease component n=1 Tax=Lipingzhangella halophila TaxID=1783352 RepID=A0A7W7RFW2_9ACTN|nr:ABC transporter permease [Lipingzhangella halophila]MBB4931224.1 ABC-type nitrate/sulfonate/bicarbonate transport system permease component [Lipingzhangella halophila]